jgi:hypothetical protein
MVPTKTTAPCQDTNTMMAANGIALRRAFAQGSGLGRRERPGIGRSQRQLMPSTRAL